MIAEEYVNQNLGYRLSNTDKTLQWLTEESASSRASCRRANGLAEYRENQNAGSLEDRQNIIVSRLNQVNDAASRARTTRIQKESLYKQMRRRPRIAKASPPSRQNPLIQQLKTRLGELQRDKVRLVERYGDKHPDVQRVNGQIADAQRQLDGEIDKTVAGIKDGLPGGTGRREAAGRRSRRPEGRRRPT